MKKIIMEKSFKTTEHIEFKNLQNKKTLRPLSSSAWSDSDKDSELSTEQKYDVETGLGKPQQRIVEYGMIIDRKKTTMLFHQQEETKEEKPSLLYTSKPSLKTIKKPSSQGPFNVVFDPYSHTLQLPEDFIQALIFRHCYHKNGATKIMDKSKIFFQYTCNLFITANSIHQKIGEKKLNVLDKSPSKNELEVWFSKTWAFCHCALTAFVFAGTSILIIYFSDKKLNQCAPGQTLLHISVLAFSAVFSIFIGLSPINRWCYQIPSFMGFLTTPSASAPDKENDIFTKV